MRRLSSVLLLFALAQGCVTDSAKRTHEVNSSSSGTFSVKRDIVYSRKDGEALKADAYISDGQGPFPGVLVIHGGGWYKGNRSQMNSIAKRLAKNGYTAINISYRLAPEHIFPAQLEDCQSALRWMRNHAEQFKIDPEHIGAFGYSAGAHLATLLGTTGQKEDGTDIQAVVAGGTPTDLRLSPNSPMVRRFLGTTIDKNPEVYREASPIAHVSDQSAPTFFYHGKWDRIVKHERSIEMNRALKQAGVSSELYLISGMGHVAVHFLNKRPAIAGIRFLDTHLKDRGEIPVD